MALLDIEKHYVFYGSYHAHPTNVLIHTIFVWPIFLTALLYIAFTPTICPLPLPHGLLPFQEYMVVNWSFLLASLYAIFYVLLDRKAGSLAALLCFACWISSNALAQKLGFPLGWKVVLISQILCWGGQFIGHGVFEGRSPALLDNLFQAFFMAPYFVLFEVLQNFFGYEPYPGFMKNVEPRIRENIAQWKSRKGTKKQA